MWRLRTLCRGPVGGCVGCYLLFEFEMMRYPNLLSKPMFCIFGSMQYRYNNYLSLIEYLST